MLIGTLFLLSVLSLLQAEKLTADQLVERHLQSIGSAAARAARTSSMAEGKVHLKFQVAGSGASSGEAVFFSEGVKLRLVLKFDNRQYLGEDIVFDGNKFAVGYAVTETRSPFGEFLHIYNSIIKEGLLGSALSTAWPLLDLKARAPKLQYKGVERIDGQPFHALRYQIRKGGQDLAISLYFDPSTFQHVRTIYKVTLSAPIGVNLQDTESRETYYKIEELFGDFRAVDGVTVPGRWDLRFSIDGRQSLQWEWEMRYDKISTNVAAGRRE